MAAFTTTLISFALLVISCQALLPGTQKPATRNVFITMKQGTGPILSQIAQQQFSSREERITTLTERLQAHSALTQAPLLNFLGSPAAALVGSPASFESFWVSNQLFIKGAPTGLLSALSSTFPSQIASIDDETISHISPIIEHPAAAEKQRKQGTPWGIPKIQALQVWAKGFLGEGIRVGIIDTGVRGTHESLKNNYVGKKEYGWYDPFWRFLSPSPADSNGHGTHCAGTILGNFQNNNIGVAPKAKWMACRGCSSFACTGYDLAACGQFMLCPHDTWGKNKNCSKAPHVISNSWGGGQGNSYDQISAAWKAAGIVGVFAIGNSGKDGCKSAGSPGDGPDVIGVGSTTQEDALSAFSSIGPGRNNRTKPDVSAPGSDIYSSWATSDKAYNTISGTSMACPHVSGLVALMLSANPRLSPDGVRSALLGGCTNSNLKVLNDKPCSEEEKQGWKFPNNYYGQGLVNALNSVKSE